MDQLGMAVTLDLGRKNDVHPPLKKPVGERLARWALGRVYQSASHLPFSGPLMHRVRNVDDHLVIKWVHVGSGLQSADGKAIRHFEICGSDRKFHPGEAKIIGKDRISVSSPNVPNPAAVRYGWSPFPEPGVNLVNSAGLPASPFTTESRFPPTGSPSFQ